MKLDLSNVQQFFPLLEGFKLVLLPTMEVVYATDQVKQILNIEEALLPTPINTLFPSILNLSDQLSTHFSEASAENNHFELEFPHHNQWVIKMNCHVLFIATGEPSCLIIDYSSTEMEVKQQLLSGSGLTADLRQILFRLPHLTMIYKADGTPVFFSEQLGLFTGLSQEELKSRMYEYLVYPDTRREVLNYFVVHLKKKVAFSIEVLVRRKDGVYRWLEGVIEPLKNEKGGITHWFGSFIDIHERKENARLLRDQMKNFDSMTRFMPQILWTLQPNGLPSFFNWRWYKYTGLSETESLTRNWVKVIHKNDQPLINDLFVMSFDDNDNSGRELRIISKNNEYRWFLCQVIPVQDEEGDVIQWLGTFTDINEQKQTEQQKDEFINIASHELKTPLTSIKAYLEIAKNYVDQKNPMSVYINGARKGTERLSTLISSLLDVTRTNELVDVSQFEYFSLQILLEDLVETFRGAYPNRKINLLGTTKVAVYGDQQRLGQVLNNLLTNAVKYSPPHSSIEVEVHRKNINFMEISVQDWGIGMPKKELKNIFKCYYRINNTRIISGLGLGLYICRKIVEAHGGWIFAESELGEGARIIFTLPISLSTEE